MPLPVLPPIDNVVYTRYRAQRPLQRASSRELLERAQAIPPPEPTPPPVQPGYRGPATTPPTGIAPPAESQAPPAAITPDLVPNQLQSGLSTAAAFAACGPAAAVAFARRMGRNPTLQEAVDIARTVGWTEGQGMAGPASQQKLLEKMGVSAKLESGVDWAKVRADVEGGNPVAISTPKHYFVATGFDPETGKFDFQASGSVLKGGGQFLTPADVTRLGGGIQGSLYLDNPEPGTAPSVVAQPAAVSGAQHAETDEGQAAVKYGLDPDIFFRQISQESGGRTDRTSPAGARGIGQFMPATAQGVAARMGGGVTAEQIMTDRQVGLDAAAFHMREQLDKYGGDYATALASYNAGEGAVAKYGGVPPFQETQTYIKRILGDERPTAGPAVAAPVSSPEVATASMPPPGAPPRTYGTPQEQIADLMTRYGQGAPAEDFATGAQAQLNDLSARYGLPAQNATSEAVTRSASIPDYQGLADQQIAQTQAARAARAAAAAIPAPTPLPEPVPPTEPVPEPGPLPGETPLDRQFDAIPPQQPYVDPRAQMGLGAGGLTPEYTPPAPVEPVTPEVPAEGYVDPRVTQMGLGAGGLAAPAAAPTALPEEPPVPEPAEALPAPVAPPPPEPANPFERVGRALVDALKGVPELAGQAAGQAASAITAPPTPEQGQAFRNINDVITRVAPLEVSAGIGRAARDVVTGIEPIGEFERTHRIAEGTGLAPEGIGLGAVLESAANPLNYVPGGGAMRAEPIAAGLAGAAGRAGTGLGLAATEQVAPRAAEVVAPRIAEEVAQAIPPSPSLYHGSPRAALTGEGPGPAGLGEYRAGFYATPDEQMARTYALPSGRRPAAPGDVPTLHEIAPPQNPMDIRSNPEHRQLMLDSATAEIRRLNDPGLNSTLDYILNDVTGDAQLNSLLYLEQRLGEKTVAPGMRGSTLLTDIAQQHGFDAVQTIEGKSPVTIYPTTPPVLRSRPAAAAPVTREAFEEAVAPLTSEAAPERVMRQPKPPAKPSTMTAGPINTELERLEKQDSLVSKEVYALAQHGQEGYRDIMNRVGPDHPVIQKSEAISGRLRALRDEIKFRTGTDYRRMPQGMKPREKAPAVSREAFEEAVRPLTNPDTSYHAYTLPTPELPDVAFRAPSKPIPDSPIPDPVGDAALGKLGATRPTVTSPNLPDRVAGYAQAGVKRMFDDRVDLKQMQAQVEAAYGADLPPHLRAVELDRITGGSDQAGRVVIEQDLQRAYNRAHGDIDALKKALEAQDNIDKAASIGQRAGAEAEQARQFSGGVNVAESQAALTRLEQRLGPERWTAIQDAMNGVYDYVDKLRDRLVSSGVWPEDFANQMKATYPHYIPTRILDYMGDTAEHISPGQKIGLSNQGWKKLTEEGTTRAREDVTASLSRMAFEVERRARKNEAALALDGWRNIDPDLADMLIDLKPGERTPLGKERVTFFRDGEKVEAAADKPLAEAIKFQSVGRAWKPVEVAGQIYRTGAVERNPTFALAANPALDSITYNYSQISKFGLQNILRIQQAAVEGFADAFKGLGADRLDGPVTQRFLLGGGGMGHEGWTRPAGAAAIGRQIERRAIVGNRVDLQRALSDAVTFGWVPRVGRRMELGYRNAAMLLEERLGQGPGQAAIMAGRQATQDFANGGTYTKALNAWIPFFNIGFQSGPWLADIARRNPKGALAAYLTLVGMPTIAAEAWNQSDPERAAAYKDVPDYVKERGIIMIKPDPWLPPDKNGNRLPNYVHIDLRNLAGPAILTREATRAAMGNASPDDWKEVSLGLLGTLTPFGGDTGVGALGALVPPIVKTVPQLLLNRDFFRNRAVVSQRAEEQALRPSQAIAKAIQNLPLGQDVKPSGVEFAIRDIGAGLGGTLLAAADLGARVKNGEPLSDAISGGPAKAPIIGGLATRFVGSSGGQVDADLRDLHSDTENAYRRDLEHALEASPAFTVMSTPEQQAARQSMQSFARDMARYAVYGSQEDPQTTIDRAKKALAALPPEEQAANLVQLRAIIRQQAEAAPETRRRVAETAVRERAVTARGG